MLGLALRHHRCFGGCYIHCLFVLELLVGCLQLLEGKLKKLQFILDLLPVLLLDVNGIAQLLVFFSIEVFHFFGILQLDQPLLPLF